MFFNHKNISKETSIYNQGYFSSIYNQFKNAKTTVFESSNITSYDPYQTDAYRENEVQEYLEELKDEDEQERYGEHYYDVFNEVSMSKLQKNIKTLEEKQKDNKTAQDLMRKISQRKKEAVQELNQRREKVLNDVY